MSNSEPDVVPPEKHGIEYPDAVDVITHDPKTDEWILYVIETDAWDTPERIPQLQEKLNNYLKFALDGELHRKYPLAVGKHVRIRLDFHQPPDDMTLRFIDLARDQIGEEGIDLDLHILE